MSGRDHDTRPHPKRHNAISGQFAARPIAMLELPAYRKLSMSAHMVISRIEVELAHHGGNDNGQLPVTVDQFVEYGMHRSSVAPAIREAEALGFIRVERGRGGTTDYHRPNKFYLTFSNWQGAKAEPPSHDWKRIKSIDEAERIAREARAAKDRNAVSFGKYVLETPQFENFSGPEKMGREKFASKTRGDGRARKTDGRYGSSVPARPCPSYQTANLKTARPRSALRRGVPPRYRGSLVFCTIGVVRFFRTGKMPL